MVDFISGLVELIGISGWIAMFSGITMGWYLAAINGFIPVRSLKRSLITNFVASVSFIFPIALERTITDSPSLEPSAWTAMWLLLITFMMAADISNYILCHYRYRN